MDREIAGLARLLARRRDPIALARLNARVASLYQLSTAEFEHILDSAPANHYAHYCLGRCLVRMGEPSKAAGHYKMAAWLRPEVTYYQEALASLR